MVEQTWWSWVWKAGALLGQGSVDPEYRVLASGHGVHRTKAQSPVVSEVTGRGRGPWDPDFAQLCDREPWPGLCRLAHLQWRLRVHRLRPKPILCVAPDPKWKQLCEFL